eukprot:Phypoly_transcript_03076.p1 GENE.Phypoly_transcript_03076~~Phypoly_transcript_03076.p1  ORF type:complete len:846 (+),score=126.53 Phypoly_transcript_03076:232-2538(+)
MARALRSVLPPGVKMEHNLRVGHGLVGVVGDPLEIDVYLPDYKLGFEYQDPHHYFQSRYGKATLEEYQKRDKMKREQAEEQGITLIDIPFWWDWNINSLLATILDKRKDLANILTKTPEIFATPISTIPPSHIAEKYTYDIPGLGTPMLALHITTYSFNPTNMLLFEKYDGMRAIWNSENRLMYSRWGREIHIPHYLADCVPSVWLDGELWFGRGKATRYQALQLSRGAPHLIQWEKLRYMIFDTPQPDLRDDAYEFRFSFLESVLSQCKQPTWQESNFIQLVPFERCTNRKFAEERFYAIRVREGEGIILRDLASPYVNGYSKFLYKTKGYYDAEALVIKQLTESTFLCKVHKNQIPAATKVRLPSLEPKTDSENVFSDKNFFTVEMKLDEKFDSEGEEIIPGQTFVSFKYVGEYNGEGPPMNPLIYTIRGDITNWDQLLHSARKTPDSPNIWKPNLQMQWGAKENQAKFLKEFAAKNQFDPLVPKNWYTITNADISAKGGRGLLARFENSHIKLLMDVFPDIGLEAHKFSHVRNNHWTDVDNRKRFFDDFAKSKGFDPLNKDKWRLVSHDEVAQTKGGSGVLSHYKGSLTNALIDVYGASADLDQEFLRKKSTVVKTESTDSRADFARNFFDNFAKFKEFDPLVADHWYCVSKSTISSEKGGASVLSKYSGSLYAALCDAYPSVRLKESKFSRLSQGYWTRRENRKKFMETVAKELKIDPLVPQNWLRFSKTDILQQKGGIEFMQIYKGSYWDALVDMYPQTSSIM